MGSRAHAKADTAQTSAWAQGAHPTRFEQAFLTHADAFGNIGDDAAAKCPRTHRSDDIDYVSSEEGLDQLRCPLVPLSRSKEMAEAIGRWGMGKNFAEQESKWTPAVYCEDCPLPYGVETMQTHCSKCWRTRFLLIPAAVATLAGAQAVAADPHLDAFAIENNVAMAKMMSSMHIKSSGDIDRDFAAMMIAHHQGAIEMAQAQLRYGKNEALRRIAQEIIVDQMQEIWAMRMALGDSLPPSAPAPTQIAAPQPASSKPSPGQATTSAKKP